MRSESSRSQSLWRLLASPVRAHRLRLLSTLAAGMVAQIAAFGCTVIAGCICALILRHSSPHALLYSALALALCVVVTALARWALAWLSHDLAFALIETLQMGIFDGIERASPGHLNSQRTGSIAATATHDAELMERFYAHMLVDYLTAFLMPAVAIVALLIIAPGLGLILLLCVTVIIMTPAFTARLAKKQGILMAEAKSVLNSQIVELARGWRDIQMFNAEDRYRNVLQQASVRLTVAQRKYGARSGLEHGLLDGLMAFTLIALLSACLYPPVSADLAPGWVPFIISIGVAALVPLLEVLHVGGQWGALRASAERVFTLHQLPESVQDRHTDIVPEGHRIEFKDVSFGYPQSEAKVLDKLTFAIEPGERVAIAGISGSGKTTLACLLLRFYDPTSGHICIDGSALPTLSLSTLRQRIAWVSQESWLFNDTIENNIRLGCPHAPFHQVQHAAKLARADEFIRALPQGYQTVCNKGGESLSGGQRQRIALARALVTHAPIIILDEVSAGLDADNERQILVALESLPEECSVITIAHRIPMLKAAHRILLLENGSIVESGSFGTLIAKGSSFSTLLNSIQTDEPLPSDKRSAQTGQTAAPEIP